MTSLVIVLFVIISLLTNAIASMQDYAICNFISGVTNMQDIGFVGWTCDSNGIAIGLCTNMWTGVACTLQGAVKSIDLSHYDLTGTVSESLGNLTSITSLKLNNNLFMGTIPASLSLATTLKTLELQSNQFSGSIPSSFCSLTHMSTFEVCDNSGISDSGCTSLSGCSPICLASSVVISYYGVISQCTVPPSAVPTGSPTRKPTRTPTSYAPTYVPTTADPTFAPTLWPTATPTTGELADSLTLLLYSSLISPLSYHSFADCATLCYTIIGSNQPWGYYWTHSTT
jgi:hypothetical protein